MTGTRALHLFANFKWTGPADPAIRTAKGLRALGLDVLFAQAAAPPAGEHRMSVELRKNRLPVTGDLALPKHYGPVSTWRDGRTLAHRLRRGDFDLLHANLLSDHLAASLAKRLAPGRVILVRSIHDPEAPPRNLRSRFAFANTDGVIVPTESCADGVRRRFRIAADRVHVQEPTTDPHRFDGITADLRRSWGLTPAHFIIGITARIQPHRRFRLLWEVAARVVAEVPEVRFVLLGRGNEHDTRTLVHEPIGRLGLRDAVILPGYLFEPEYSQAIATLDLFVFLVPGSDGTCRAVREALAAGLPVVATKRGILPAMLGRRYAGPAREPCGLLLEEDVAVMSSALIKLIRNREAQVNLRDAALCRVAELMDPVRASQRLAGFYAGLRETRA